MKLILRLTITAISAVPLLLGTAGTSIFSSLTTSNILVAAQAESKLRLTDEKIRDVAQLITVRVYSVDDEHWEKGTIGATSGNGSGILLERKELSEQNLYHYLVLTNEHVLREEEQYDTYVKTPDGMLHRAYNHKAANEKFDEAKVDLGLLWFLSPLKYEIAKPEESESLLEKDSDIFIAGFPCSETSRELECPAEYYFTAGKGGEVDQPLKKGYQIYFDNKTKEGTSGGPILNAQGRLIGINGRGTNTPNRNQYSYADGKGVPDILRDKSPGLGIPFRTYRKIAPQEPFQDIELSDKDIVYREVVVFRERPVNPPENREDMNFSLLELLLFFLIVALILYLIFSWRFTKKEMEQKLDKLISLSKNQDAPGSLPVHKNNSTDTLAENLSRTSLSKNVMNKPGAETLAKVRNIEDRSPNTSKSSDTIEGCPPNNDDNHTVPTQESNEIKHSFFNKLKKILKPW